ncbi:MAG: serine--tRNA ligase [Alphaproteobacteria bacterium]|nr:serine--tRNA ligase [Alphaproteobacteria bacterium]
MLDIKWIRDNPDALDHALSRRGAQSVSKKLLELDIKRRDIQTELQTLQQQRNTISKDIGLAKQKGDIQADSLMAEMTALRNKVQELENLDKNAALELDALLDVIPNIPYDDVPTGKDEKDNVILRKVGTPKTFSFKPKEHFDIGEKLGMMDFERAAKMSGARFVVLSDALSRLERALAAFMLDVHTMEFNYREITPPYLVKDIAVYGAAQLPRFAEDLFQTTNGYWLISTAEVPLTNLVNNEILKEDELPLRFVAYSPCFRSEAGAAGKDTRGMIRQHQFTKVELVSISHPDKSQEEHERMTKAAETILQRLELPYQVMVLSTGDMSPSSKKTYDLEVWLPGQDCYREISSCSNFGDYQSRRMRTRFKPNEGKDNRFVHTLNGSGLAIGRTMVAILENYQQEDGSVIVPEALRSYMKMDVIKPNV